MKRHLIILAILTISANLVAQSLKKISLEKFTNQTESLLDTLSKMDLVKSFSFCGNNSDSICLSINYSSINIIFKNGGFYITKSKNYSKKDSLTYKLISDFFSENIMEFDKPTDRLYPRFSFNSSAYIKSAISESVSYAYVAWNKYSEELPTATHPTLLIDDELFYVDNLRYIDKGIISMICVTRFKDQFLKSGGNVVVYTVEDNDVKSYIIEFNYSNLDTYYIDYFLYVIRDKAVIIPIFPGNPPITKEEIMSYKNDMRLIYDNLKKFIN